MENLKRTPEEQAEFRLTLKELAEMRLTPEVRADAKQRLCERLTEYIADLRRQLEEAEAEKKKLTDNTIRPTKIESAKSDNTKYRTPIPKKDYTSEWENIKLRYKIPVRRTFEEMYKDNVEPSP
jgi:hypothetical protein